MQTIIAFIVVFGSLVFFHELGHFIFAKRAGILVREFAIGFGPKIYGHQKGETMYTIRLLPLGGYVRYAGEDFDTVELQPGYRVALQVNEDNEVTKIMLNQNDKQLDDIIFMEVEKADLTRELWVEGYDEEDQFVRYNVSRNAIIIKDGTEELIAPFDRQFESKSVGHRFMTIFAGPLFNFILAFFIFLALALMQGVPSKETPVPIIDTVVAEGPAEVAGMEAGDLVLSADGEKVATWGEFTSIIAKKGNEKIDVVVDRAGKEVDLTIAVNLVKDKKTDEEYGQIGVTYAPLFDKVTLGAIPYAAEQVWYWSTLIFKILGDMVTGGFSIDMLSGPVGIYKVTEEVTSYGIFTLMNFAGMLSINLGIMNLLPIPALDGGRLIFIIIEAVRGKPVDRQKEGMVHFVGIMLLFLLMIAVTWNDIQRFFFN